MTQHLYQRIVSDPLEWAIDRARTYRERRQRGYQIYPYMEAVITLADEIARLRRERDAIADEVARLEALCVSSTSP